MAIISLSKSLISCLIISLFILYVVEADDHNIETSTNIVSADPVSFPNIDCGGACEMRCKLPSRPNLCKRACGTCCARCGCVPPGTSGGYDACPCYAHLTTRGGRRKCP